MIHHISAEHLTIERIGEIIKNGYKLELSDDARNRIVRCREYLDKKIAETKVPIYGVTTGFGSLCNVSIGKDHLAQLQINLMMSHACGTGDRVPNEIVKIMLLLKIQSLSYGYSGCQLETVERLIDFFNNGVYPVVYMQGSLGASGDLVPLAHLCLPLVGLGDVEYQGDGNKAIFYYIADDRVDFRQLIKVLAETFRVRIEMKQIGARQEAGRIGGIGPCGRELCCATWMTSFVSVSTSAARYQDISLNPQKLAGQCAKLKCCLNYEIDCYVEAQRRLPSKEVTLLTKDAEFFFFKADILSGQVTYSTDKSIAANAVTISARRAFEIINLNKRGIKPDSLQDLPENENRKAADLLEQESVTRFDRNRKGKKGGGGEKKPQENAPAAAAQPAGNNSAAAPGSGRNKKKKKQDPARRQDAEAKAARSGEQKPAADKPAAPQKPAAEARPKQENQPRKNGNEGQRKADGGNPRKPEGGEPRKPENDNQRKPDNAQRKPDNEGQRKADGGNPRKPEGEQRKPENDGQRKPENNRKQRPANRPKPQEGKENNNEKPVQTPPQEQ